MASWKKVIVSGSDISQLNNDAGYVASVGGGLISASAEGDNQGQIKLNGINVDINALGTGDNPTFASVTASLKGDVVGNLTGDVTGNADTATALASGQNFSIAGDGTAAAVSFDGTGAVELSLSLADDSVDSDEIADGAVDAVHFSADAGTAISGAFTDDSASFDTRISDLETAQFDLDFQGDTGGALVIENGETLDIAGGTNVSTVGSGNTLTVNLDADISLTSVTASVKGDVDGNADTATALASGQNFSITGDGTAAAVSFDGTGAVALSLSLADDSVDSDEIADGAVDAVHFSADAGTAISGAFTSTSASIASDIADLEAAQYDLDIAADSGTASKVSNAQTLTIQGTTNEIETSVSGQTITVGLPNDVVIAGNLTVSGTTTTVDTVNLNVTDQFINLNDGGGAADGGLVIEGAGTSFGWDNSEGRWAFDYADATEGQTAIGADAFAAAVVTSDDTNYRKNGNIRIDTSTEDIFIWS
jgi:hypothetical protein